MIYVAKIPVSCYSCIMGITVRKQLRTRLGLFAALFILAAFSLFARDVRILVEDADLNMPLEGATIRSWDGSQHACDENGVAVITVPDDRQVLVQIAYPGYEGGRLVITLATDSFTVGLRLSGVMEGKELVLEAGRPGSSETRTGRSVAVSGRDVAQTAEIGIIEDVMSSVKLLPGVGYAGFFNAQPSIRGGDPEDLSASVNGHYVMNPYHWYGGFSIFDPRMVASAQLSHGVFSSRYGNTVSGLLEITAKEPSTTDTEFELGASTSAASANLSFPLGDKGGVLVMGRATYYDPVVWGAQELAKEIKALEVVNSIDRAPYIYSGTITGNYRFSSNLELHATGFWGMDGVAVTFRNPYFLADGLNSRTDIDFEWTNYQGFFTTGLSWNPRNDMLLKFTAGAGYEQAKIDGEMVYDIKNKPFSPEFKNGIYGQVLSNGNLVNLDTPYNFDTINASDTVNTLFNAQGRVDYDWDIGSGFIVAAGAQELFLQSRSEGYQASSAEMIFNELSAKNQEELTKTTFKYNTLYQNAFMQEYSRVSFLRKFNPDAGNMLFTTSAYGLAEYFSPNNRFNAELGLRVDHYYLLGDGISLSSLPIPNPRLNVDFNVFKNRGSVRSFDLSAGTGLFSSMNGTIMRAEKDFKLQELKPNRSWTSIVGAKLELPEGLNINIEGYYKRIWDRLYVPIKFFLPESGSDTTVTSSNVEVTPRFNGKGNVWGIDLMIQKLQSRYWDGWLSCSYNWAMYWDPEGGYSDLTISGGTRGKNWYFPAYHRYINLNLVFNVRPTPRINIYTRFGLATGEQVAKPITDTPVSYPVLVYDPDNVDNSYFIEKYYWPTVLNDRNRNAPALPMDIKLSIFGKNASGKARYEVYVAVENVLIMIYNAQNNTTFNAYTGKTDTGSNIANYEIPVPIPSFGFKYSY